MRSKTGRSVMSILWAWRVSFKCVADAAPEDFQRRGLDGDGSGFNRKYKLSYLIAGYNTASQREKEKYDEEKLVRAVGNFLMTAAALLILGGISSAILTAYSRQVILSSWIAFAIYTAIWLVYVNTGGRVMKDG